MDVGVHGIHPELLKLLGRMKFRSSYGQNALRHSIEVAQLSGMLVISFFTEKYPQNSAFYKDWKTILNKDLDYKVKKNF